MSISVRDLAVLANHLVPGIADTKEESIVMASESSKRLLISSLTDCETLSKLLNLSEPLSSQLENGDNKSACLTVVVRIKCM